MGRTLPPFSQLIEHERRAWAPFRRALRKADQATFDRLFECAKLHVQAGVYLSRPWPFEVIAMAMLLEHHKRLERLLAQLDAHDDRACPATLDTSQDPPAPPPRMTVALLPLEEGWSEGDSSASPSPRGESSRGRGPGR
jgi:hypothetical protein